MAPRIFRATAAAVAMAVGLACSQASNPVSPSPTAGAADAAADGSTLKVTAPGLVSPRSIRTDTLEPEYVLTASTARFKNGAVDLTYRIQVQRANGQAVAETAGVQPAADGRGRWKAAAQLDLDVAYRWRARAELGTAFGPWSPWADFLSLDYRGLVPRPPNGAWPTTGEAVVDYVSDSFPELLKTTALTAQRVANMEFLRDRIIETGICGGLDLAHNRKRGFGEHSIDALAWRRPSGRVAVMDIANAYDDKTIPLVLHWAEVEGPSGYDAYLNHPGC